MQLYDNTKPKVIDPYYLDYDKQKNKKKFGVDPQPGSSFNIDPFCLEILEGRSVPEPADEEGSVNFGQKVLDTFREFAYGFADQFKTTKGIVDFVVGIIGPMIIEQVIKFIVKKIVLQIVKRIVSTALKAALIAASTGGVGLIFEVIDLIGIMEVVCMGIRALGGVKADIVIDRELTDNILDNAFQTYNEKINENRELNCIQKYMKQYRIYKDKSYKNLNAKEKREYEREVDKSIEEILLLAKSLYKRINSRKVFDNMQEIRKCYPCMFLEDPDTLKPYPKEEIVSYGCYYEGTEDITNTETGEKGLLKALGEPSSNCNIDYVNSYNKYYKDQDISKRNYDYPVDNNGQFKGIKLDDYKNYDIEKSIEVFHKDSYKPYENCNSDFLICTEGTKSECYKCFKCPKKSKIILKPTQITYSSTYDPYNNYNNYIKNGNIETKYGSVILDLKKSNINSVKYSNKSIIPLLLILFIIIFIILYFYKKI